MGSQLMKQKDREQHQRIYPAVSFLTLIMISHAIKGIKSRSMPRDTPDCDPTSETLLDYLIEAQISGHSDIQPPDFLV